MRLAGSEVSFNICSEGMEGVPVVLVSTHVRRRFIAPLFA